MDTPYSAISASSWVEDGSAQSLSTPLQNLLTQGPIVCSANTSLVEAVQLMHTHNISSVAITDPNHALEGIFTLRDLRRVFADASIERTEPVGQFMTEAPFSLSPLSTAFEAALLMTRYHIGHVCIVEDEKLLGVLSERDLFSLQRVDLVRLSRALRYAESLEELQALRQHIAPLLSNMLVNGVNAPQVTGLITQLNDHTTTRVIELNINAWTEPLPEFCWLAFGSEGRHEQSILTDQDNGILFYPANAQDPEACRQRLLPLAHRINHDLDACGLVLCPGNIMASNPELCRSEHEWQQLFSRIIHSPDPNNILKASIYFDVRGVWGNCEGLARLLPTMLRTIHDHPPFERLMATNVLSYRLPFTNPLALLGSWLGLHQTTLDLKAQALTPFVDAARILALSHNIEAASTLERLRLLHEKKLWSDADYEALQHAYSYIQRLRLSLHSEQFQAGQPLSNQLDLVSLNPLERRILRASVRQVYRLLQSVRFKYQL